MRVDKGQDLSAEDLDSVGGAEDNSSRSGIYEGVAPDEAPLYATDEQGNLIVSGVLKVVDLTRHATSEERLTLDAAREILNRLSDRAKEQ